MTFRKCYTAALKELGCPDEAIQSVFKLADNATSKNTPFLNSLVPSGMENKASAAFKIQVVSPPTSAAYQTAKAFLSKLERESNAAQKTGGFCE